VINRSWFLFCLFLAVAFVAAPEAHARAPEATDAGALPGTRSASAEMKALLARGDAAEAIRLGEAALGGAKGRVNEQSVAEIIQLQALGYLRLGLPQYASKVLRERIAAIPPDDTAGLPPLLSLLGQASILGGRLEEAEQTIDRASAMLKEKPQREQFWPLVLKAHIRYRQKRNADAMKLCREAEAAAASLGDATLQAFVLTERAQIARQSGNIPLAAASFSEALDRYLNLGETHDAVYGIIASAYSLARLPATTPAERAKLATAGTEALRRAVDSARRLSDDRALSQSLGKWGDVLETEEKLDEALGKTLLALHQAQRAQLLDLVYLWQHQAGRILKKQKNMPRALDMYRMATQSLNLFKKGLAQECGIADGSFQEMTKPVYLDLAELLIDAAEASADAGEKQLLLLEARKTVEALRTEELRDYFEDACLGAERTERASLSDVPPHTALIYTIMLPSRMELLVTLPDGIKRFRVAESSATVGREVRILRLTIENRFPAWVTSARKLYDWLIRPIEADLARHDVTTIVFVPDGPLRNIPLTVLHDGTRSIIEKYAVATIQGLSFASAPSAGGERPGTMMLAGLSESVQGYPALTNVTEEAKGIRTSFPGVSLINRDFQVQKVKEQLDLMPYPLIHIASHGEFTGNARNNYILTWDGRMTLDHLDRFIKNSAIRKTPVELLSLSACRTAAGDDRASLGLAGLAVKSGARTAVASLWDIDDKSTSELFIEFYHIVKEGGNISRAEALRRAQLIIRQRYDHPYFWSPFLLIGNWL
jgi:CHAT domain-containing protein